MVDGSFRENLFGAEYFLNQDFPTDEYEVIWVEFYEHANEQLPKSDRLQTICLSHPQDEVYHPSRCFNAGIKAASGEVVVIPDADQIVEPNYLSIVWKLHEEHPKSAIYGYRFDEIEDGVLENNSFEELKNKCILKNIKNFGGCLSVRKKYLEEINGYDEHPAFATGFHANGTDVNQRLKNLGLGTIWSKDLILYHPWHPFTLANFHVQTQYHIQLKVINWKAKRFITQTFNGIDDSKNIKLPFPFTDEELQKIEEDATPKPPRTGLRAGFVVAFPEFARWILKLIGKNVEKYQQPS